MSPERSEGYRREAATRMTESSGHDFAKQKHGYNIHICRKLNRYEKRLPRRRKPWLGSLFAYYYYYEKGGYGQFYILLTDVFCVRKGNRV